MFCTKCGSQISSDAQVCPACGQPLAAAASATAPPVAWTPPVGVQAQTGRWIAEGWRMVNADMGNYVLLALVFMVLNGAVPLILQGPLLAGFHIFCIKKTLNRPAELADLFKGFDYFVPALVASLLISLFVLGGTLLCIIPGLVLAAMYKFTYLFIVDKRMDFWPAMQASHAVVKNDYFGFTIFLLAMAGVNLLGLLCCIVGLLVTMPVTFAAITVAYKEIVGFEPSTVEII
jgi:uncharacterized membrane protein